VEDSGAPVTTTMVPSGPDFVPGNIQGGFARLLGHTRERRLARPAGALGCCSPCCGLVGLVRAIPRRSSRRQSVKRRRRRSSLSLHCVSPSPAPIALAPRDGRSRSAAFAQLAPARVATGSGERFPCCPHDFGSEFCHRFFSICLPARILGHAHARGQAGHAESAAAAIPMETCRCSVFGIAGP
jgi:hypothetical protein